MSKKINVAVVLGTARAGRESEKAARFVLEELSKRSDMEVTFVDVRDHLFGKTIPPWEEPENPATKPWRDIILRTDAFFIVTPEYNHGYPGELKMLLDAGYGEYKGKAVAIAGVSAGGFGGVRMIEQLRLVTLEINLTPTHGALHFPRVGPLFSKEGEMTDASYGKRVSDLADELVALARRLSGA